MYLGPCQIFVMEPLDEIVNNFKQITIFAKGFIVDVCQGARYAFDNDAHCHLKDPFIVSRKQILLNALVYMLLTLNIFFNFLGHIYKCSFEIGLPNLIHQKSFIWYLIRFKLGSV